MQQAWHRVRAATLEQSWEAGARVPAAALGGHRWSSGRAAVPQGARTIPLSGRGLHAPGSGAEAQVGERHALLLGVTQSDTRNGVAD